MLFQFSLRFKILLIASGFLVRIMSGSGVGQKWDLMEQG
jgi:hypothetical protein